MTTTAPLAGVRIIEASMLGPAAITTNLVDLGAEVIKVEPPAGDYGREMTWPIVEGTSLLFLHANRGKRSIAIDLRTPEGVEVFRELARTADAVVEAMRPGALARRGLGYEDLKAVNPKIVFMTISGYGMTGPYKDLPSHGIAYDTWAGIVPPAYDEEGFCYIPEHLSVGINAAPVMGAMGILAGIIQARATGEGCQMEIAQSDAAAAMDWLRSETYKAYERPESEVTGNKADGYERRAPGTGGMKEGVRYQMYDSADGHILFMASEQSFWKTFCENIGRPELFERYPGSKYADHARATASCSASCATSSSPRPPTSGWRGRRRTTPCSRPSTRRRRWPMTRTSRPACRGSRRRPTGPTCSRARSSSSAPSSPTRGWPPRPGNTPTTSSRSSWAMTRNGSLRCDRRAQ